VTPLIESGRGFLPQTSGWVQGFLDETAAFPNAAHDDCVGSLAQALNYLRSNYMPSCIYVVTRGFVLCSAGTSVVSRVPVAALFPSQTRQKTQESGFRAEFSKQSFSDPADLPLQALLGLSKRTQKQFR